MARIVPTILLHFLHPWRSDVGSAENAGAIFPLNTKRDRNTVELTGAEIIIECLKAEGTDYVFG